MKLGSVVIAHFVQPTEKYWGKLQSLGAEGVTLRGINLSSFEDWLSQVSRGESDDLGFSTLFVPLSRVERVFLDEPSGAIPSYGDRLMDRTGKTLEDVLAASDG